MSFFNSKNKVNGIECPLGSHFLNIPVKKYGKTISLFKTLGYKEVISYLNNEITYDDMAELIKKNTRNYAKRQLTFIRHQFDVEYYVDINNVIMSL